MAKRSGEHFSWNVGHPPTDKAFIEKHAELHNIPYDEAYNEVYRTMITTQEMLLSNKRFMLPGIGIIGLAKNPHRGLVLASSTFWFMPGLLSVIAKAPGWENAPLNCYLTNNNMHNINKLLTYIVGDEKILMSEFQYYNASDFGKEGDILSDEKLEYYNQAASKEWRRKRGLINKLKRKKND